MHRGQHGLRARLGRRRVDDRRVVRRRLQHAGQRRRLRQRHVARRPAEIAVRRGVHAIGAGAEIDPVEIEREDLLLRQAHLQPHGQDHLLHLALEGALRLEEQVLGELLGDGRAALHHAAGREDWSSAARARPIGIDAEMPVEAAVLDGDHRLRQVGRHLVERQALAGRIAVVGDQLAVGGEDAHVRRRAAARSSRPSAAGGWRNRRRSPRSARCR